MGDKQLQILKSYRENPHQTLREIAESLCISFKFVQKTIDKYIEFQKIDKKLYLAPSHIDSDVYFLFDNFSERRVVVNGGVVQNIDDFTEYEVHWIERQKLRNIAVKSEKKEKQKKSEYYVCTYITANDYESKFIVRAKSKKDAQTKFKTRVRSRKRLVDITEY